MKKVSIISLTLFCSFLGSEIYASPASLDSIPTTVKTWCLALNKQNKELIIGLSRKDSIVHLQGTLLDTRSARIKSYERDSISTNIQLQAYSTMTAKYDTIVTKLNSTIKKQKTQLKLSWASFGGILLLILLL